MADLRPEEALVRAWEKTVDVQQHFNVLCLRVRNFAVTLTTGLAGGALLAFREAPHLVPWILLVRVFAWIGFYMMDAGWYHQLLLGAVKHGEDIEKQLEEKGLPGFGLAQQIRATSGVTFLYWEWRSPTRLKIFYRGAIVIFLSLFVVTLWITRAGFPEIPKPLKVDESSIRSKSPKLLFPPRGAQISGAQAVTFGWELVSGAHGYRLVVQDSQNEEVLSVMLPATSGSFVANIEDFGLEGVLRWRALPVDLNGVTSHPVEWQEFSI